MAELTFPWEILPFFFLVAFLYSSVGHGGASGRFESYKETAMEYAFMLDLINIKK